MPDSNALKWQFWLLWVLASALGGALINPVVRAAAYSVSYAGGGAVINPVVGAAIGVVGGAIGLGSFMGAIGFAQWLVLRWHVSWAVWWLLATIVGGAAGGAVLIGVLAALGDPEAGEPLSGIAGVVMGFTVLGVAQWLVLRRQVPWAGWLALASVVGWFGGGLGAGLIAALAGGGQAGTGAGFGAGYGAITGGALVIFSSRAATSTPVAQGSTT